MSIENTLLFRLFCGRRFFFSLIVLIWHCRGKIQSLFQTTSHKPDVISVLPPLASPCSLSLIFRILFYTRSKLFRNSVCLVVQYIGIGAISEQEYCHRETGYFLGSRSLWLTKEAFLAVLLLWICVMLRLLTSYSNDKRKKGSNIFIFWSKGQRSIYFRLSSCTLFLTEYLYTFKSHILPTL